jgi:hypothetical protein
LRLTTQDAVGNRSERGESPNLKRCNIFPEVDMIVTIFGLIWMIKGEIKVSKRRRINARTGCRLGAFMFIGSLVLSFVSMPEGIYFISLGILVVLPFIIGFVFAEEVGHVSQTK